MNLDEELAKLHEVNNAADTPPETPPAPAAAATPAGEPPPVAAPAPPARPPLSLDDLLPDAEDIPPTFRGKPFRALLDDRRSAISQRDDIGKVKNDYESELRVTRSLLQTLIEQQAKTAATQPAPAAPQTAEERARAEQLDAMITADPAYALGRTADIAAEAARNGFKGEIAPLAATVARLESEANARRIFDAHTQAGHSLGRDAAAWKGEAETNAISAAVLALQLPLDQADSYVTASKWLDDLASVRAPKPTPTPQSTTAASPAPSQPAPTAPAPPVGTGAPAATADVVVPALDSRDQDNLDRMRKLYKEATKQEMPKEVWEGTYRRVAANAPRRRSA